MWNQARKASGYRTIEALLELSLEMAPFKKTRVALNPKTGVDIYLGLRVSVPETL